MIMFNNFTLTDLITVPFGWFLYLLYQITSNYGVAIILFSICVSLLMHPLRLMNAVSGAKKARLQPKVVAVRKMFPGDVKTQNEIVRDLYFEKEKIRPYSVGVLTTIIPLFVLMALFGVVSSPLINMLGVDRTQASVIFDMITKLDPVQFPEGISYNELLLAQLIPEHAEMVKHLYPTISEKALTGINFDFLGLDLAQTPNLNLAEWESVDWPHIGMVLLPTLAATINVLPKVVRSLVNAFFKRDAAERKNGKGFNLFSALLTLMFIVACFNVPAAMSLYWLIQNIMSEILQIHIRKCVNNLPPETCSLEELVAPYRKTTAET